jgi:hypothetical protein
MPTLATAYELNGSLFDYKEGDGSYTVVVQNNEGHEYIGTAEERNDGSLAVTIRDDRGDTYKGNATETQEGHYHLNLKNISSGHSASGELEEE